MNGDRLIRWSTVAAVSGVAVVAGWVSYDHALAVVRAYGETGAVSWLYPGTIDGLIYSASMVLLDAARRQAPAPRLARWTLAGGIAATLVVNVAAGLHFGSVGAAVASWPAFALVGSYESLMLIIRSSATRAAEAGQASPAAQVARDAEEAARNALRATRAARNPLSGRQMADCFGLNRAQVAQVRTEVLGATNGHSEGGDAS